MEQPDLNNRVINSLALRIAQLEVDKAILEAKLAILEEAKTEEEVNHGDLEAN